MKRTAIILILLVGLLGCQLSDLPEAPDTPGKAHIAGRAGIYIPQESLPSWSRLPSKDFSVEAVNLKVGDTQSFTFGNPFATKEYATWSKMYYLLDGQWIPLETTESKSDIEKNKGWIVSQRAGWTLPITEQFAPLIGDERLVYVLIYSCTKTGKQWDCGAGVEQPGKWQIDLFKVTELGKASKYIITQNIEGFYDSYKYIGLDSDGTSETGTYETQEGIEVEVKVTPYKKYKDLLQALKKDIQIMNWGKIGDVYGFQEEGYEKTTFIYASDKYLVSITTHEKEHNAIDVIKAYDKILPHNTELMKDLTEESTPECGNNKREADEQCDKEDDDACPGRCQADCTCALAYCGDEIVHDEYEQCDPPGKICEIPSDKKWNKLGICGQTCKCEPQTCNKHQDCKEGICIGETCVELLLGATYCGDGIVQQKNNYGIEEKCDYQANKAISCEKGQTCNPVKCVCEGQADIAVCGNSALEKGEECEIGQACTAEKICTSECKCAAPVEFAGATLEEEACGDGKVRGEEECDYLNPCAEGFACDDRCKCIPLLRQDSTIQPQLTIKCGNGIIEDMEQCDPPTNTATQQCAKYNNFGALIEGYCTNNCKCAFQDIARLNGPTTVHTGLAYYNQNYNNQDSRSQTITAYAVKDVVPSGNKQYAVFILATLAILIITAINFIEFSKK